MSCPRRLPSLRGSSSLDPWLSHLEPWEFPCVPRSMDFGEPVEVSIACATASMTPLTGSSSSTSITAVTRTVREGALP